MLPSDLTFSSAKTDISVKKSDKQRNLRELGGQVDIFEPGCSSISETYPASGQDGEEELDSRTRALEEAKKSTRILTSQLA
jgi:hypothetical protein